jgi:hypothetical protein
LNLLSLILYKKLYKNTWQNVKSML